MELYPQQQQALSAVTSFLAGDKQVFILRGYAGTGKTTLISHIHRAAVARDMAVRLTAPTGRAAHVLTAKTGITASTIHRAIYTLDQIETDDSDPNHLVYFFPLMQQQSAHSSKVLTIVDEASMVSTKRQMGEIFRFGTGQLLPDLLTNSRPHNGGKIIFIGDPAQLPPVGETVSHALAPEYFLERGLRVDTFTLTDIVRQRDDSLILANSMKLRTLLASPERTSLKLDVDGHEVVSARESELVPLMLEKFPVPEMNQTAIIAPTNALTLSYNRDVRERLFPGKPHIVAGDIVINSQNRYNVNNKADVMNGDFLKVTLADHHTDTITEQVRSEIGGVETTVEVTMTFRDVHLLTAGGTVLKCKIIDSFVNEVQPQLTTEQVKALYINFCKRVPRGVRRDSEAFKHLLKTDPFYNALRVKYGYAITCHKAQGGEWDTVFVDFHNRVRLNDDDLRWSYTAITRASHCLVAANLPRQELLQRLDICQIVKTSAPAVHANAIPVTPPTPFHGADSSPLLRAKYWTALADLEEAGFAILNVEHKPWTELYTVATPQGVARVDCWYNAKNAFTRVAAAKGADLPSAPQLIEIFKRDIRGNAAVQADAGYTPSASFLEALYDRMRGICSEAGVAILGVDENLPQYCVNYALKTSGRAASLKFYFDAKHCFTSVMPASDLGDDDTLLLSVINRLNH